MNNLGVDSLTPEKCCVPSLEVATPPIEDNIYQSEKANQVNLFSLKSPLQNLTMLSQEELFNKSPLTFAEDLPKLEIKNANQQTLS